MKATTGLLIAAVAALGLWAFTRSGGAMAAPRTAEQVREDVWTKSTSPLTQTQDWAYALSISSEFPTQTTQEIYDIVEYNRQTQTASLLERWLAANGLV